MTEFVEAASLDQLSPGKCMRFMLADADIAIFNVEGSIYAIGDSCAHMGGSLSGGRVIGTTIKCPVHGFIYDLKTGFLGGKPGGLAVPSYPVKVENGKVFVSTQKGGG